MTRHRSILLLTILLFFVLPSSILGQDIAMLWRKAETFEKAFRDEDALKVYLEIVKHDPKNINALCKSSQLYNVVGKRLSSKDQQKKYYLLGQEYAKKAIKINPNHSEANFAMAISMGRLALISSGKDKIKAVKDIKMYADKCIQVDPSNYKGYHVLGKWHYEVSDLNSLERWLVKVTYGGLPESSVDDAVKNYERSMKLYPAFILNYLELAKAYRRKGEINKAKTLLLQMEKLPPAASDDVKIKSLGRKMLNEL